MAEKENAKAIDMKKITMITNMILLLCGLIYVIVVTVSGYNAALWYKLSLMVLMMGYSLLFNIAALYGMNAFENMTRQQGRNYFGYMIFDVVELCFLAMFVVNVGDFDEPFHYIALGVFLILTIPRHILYHSAVDDVKQAKPAKNVYNTITSMDGYKKQGHGKKTEKDEGVPPRNINKINSLKVAKRMNRNAFPEPELKEDRFVSMKLDELGEYVDSSKSVDEKGNVRIDK